MSWAKALTLLDEAERDLAAGCYNKAASAAYFAARMATELLVAARQGNVPRRDDKLANVLLHWGRKDLAAALLELYQYRVMADYGSTSLDVGVASRAVDMARRLLGELRHMSA